MLAVLKGSHFLFQVKGATREAPPFMNQIVRLLTVRLISTSPSESEPELISEDGQSRTRSSQPACLHHTPHQSISLPRPPFQHSLTRGMPYS
jgi:hypothetical protein